MLTRCGVKISNDNFNGLSHTPATLFVFGTHKDICEQEHESQFSRISEHLHYKATLY